QDWRVPPSEKSSAPFPPRRTKTSGYPSPSMSATARRVPSTLRSVRPQSAVASRNIVVPGAHLVPVPQIACSGGGIMGGGIGGGMGGGGGGSIIMLITAGMPSFVQDESSATSETRQTKDSRRGTRPIYPASSAPTSTLGPIGRGSPSIS